MAGGSRDVDPDEVRQEHITGGRMIELAYWRWGTGRPRPPLVRLSDAELARLRFVRWLLATGRISS